MLESIQERYDESKDCLGGMVGIDPPDGANAGISKTESMVALGSALAATFVVRHLLQATWRTALDREPPKNPASHDVEWKDALLWGAISGAVVGIARIGSRRLTSSAYRNLS